METVKNYVREVGRGVVHVMGRVVVPGKIGANHGARLKAWKTGNFYPVNRVSRG